MPDKKIHAIIQAALAGEEKAYEFLLNRYQRGVYNIIYQMIKNREETEDLVQETFIKAFKALESYNDRYAFSTWLYKIAYNNCIDSIRKKKIRTYPIDKPIVTKEGTINQEIRDESTSPEKDLLYSEKKTLIQKSIDQLPIKYQQIIHLRHREDKSYEEISQILNIPLGTVKARMFRAREILKKKIFD